MTPNSPTWVLPMKYWFSVIVKMTVSSLFICGLPLLSVLTATAQNLDEVHVTPRNNADKPSGTTVPDIVPVNAEGALYAHPRPFRVSVDLVLVPVTVTDTKERPVLSLAKRDFALYEDDRPQEIRYFSAEPEPMSIAILLDVSKSMTDKVDTERAAVAEFFKNADPKDEYFAITFSNRPRVLASSTQSIDELQEKLTGIEPGGPTAMLDGIYLAESQLRSARYKRKAILLITDGGDNSSRFTMREIKNLVVESDVQIYAIGLFETFFFNTFEERMGKRWLREITDPTGGRTVTVDSRLKLPDAAAEISREMRNEYILGYQKTAGRSNRWRKIKVEVNAATARALRTSYKRGYITAE